MAEIMQNCGCMPCIYSINNANLSVNDVIYATTCDNLKLARSNPTQVATRPADNPVGAMARKFHLGGHMARNAPRLSLPGKLVFPSAHNSGHFSMLGLGDIVMPGLLLCFVMRYDAYKRAQVRRR